MSTVLSHNRDIIYGNSRDINRGNLIDVVVACNITAITDHQVITIPTVKRPQLLSNTVNVQKHRSTRIPGSSVSFIMPKRL